QLRLTPDEWDGIVEGGELRAQRDDQLVVTRVRHPVVDVDAQNVDRRGALIQPLADQPRRRRLLVLTDPRAALRLDSHDAAAGFFNRPDTSSATWRTAAANRSTISASSASLAV